MAEKVAILQELPTADGAFGEPMRAVIFVTYMAQGLPPRVVKVPALNYTAKVRDAAIKADLEKFRVELPHVVELP